MMENSQLTVAISPKAGRLVHLSFKHQANLLRQDLDIAGTAPQADTSEFFNHGGDWFWPTSQTNWHLFGSSDWPPAKLIEGRPWTGRAWEGADGTCFVSLTQDYDSPLNLRVTRQFVLPPNAAHITIHQKAESKTNGSIPISLWNVTQIGDADFALLPTSPDMKQNGVEAMKFGDPNPSALSSCGSYLVYTPEADSIRKLGGRVRPSWIAAKKNGTLILEVMTEPHPEANHPDGDFTVEMFSGTDPKYIEIETLSAEEILSHDETIENHLTIALLKDPAALTPCDWGDLISRFIDALTP